MFVTLCVLIRKDITKGDRALKTAGKDIENGFKKQRQRNLPNAGSFVDLAALMVKLFQRKLSFFFFFVATKADICSKKNRNNCAMPPPSVRPNGKLLPPVVTNDFVASPVAATQLLEGRGWGR